MAEMQIRYSLRSLEEVAPWGEPGHLNLHWYGLTDGTYWIDACGHTLLRYSDRVLETESTSSEPCVDYHVARLHEDILSMLPAVLEEVPADLAELVASLDDQHLWQRRWEEWLQQQPGDEDEDWDKYWLATGWWGDRRLDLGYLCSAPKIWIWRTRDMMHIRWDCRARDSNGDPLWAEELGQCNVPVAEFISALTGFHNRFMSEMADRVRVAVENWPRPIVHIDVDQLLNEQRRREMALKRALSPHHATDWNVIRKALVL